MKQNPQTHIEVHAPGAMVCLHFVGGEPRRSVFLPDEFNDNPNWPMDGYLIVGGRSQSKEPCSAN